MTPDGTFIDTNETCHSPTPREIAINEQMVRLDRIDRVMAQVRGDCEADARSSEGAPFTGKEIGKRLGEIYAMIAIVAEAVQRLAQEAGRK